jgi:hypothetical protein
MVSALALVLVIGGVVTAVPAIATPGDLIISGWGAQEGIQRFDPDSGVFTQLNAIGSDNPDLAIGLDGTIWKTNFGSLIGYDPLTGSPTTIISGGYRAVAVEPIPEPSTCLLLVFGLVGIALKGRSEPAPLH